MAMNGTNMGTEVKAAIDALSSTDRVDPPKCFIAMCTAMIAHMHTNATVTVTTSDGALQLDSTGHITQPPSVNATLPGGCIQ